MNRLGASPSQSSAGLDEWAPSLLKAQLYNRILVDIIIGVLGPGEHLDENVLARRYNGGLAGVRDALARLALEGLVVRKARVGTTVALLDPVEARDAFEARRAVEANDSRALAAMDEAFHVAVATASGNRTLAKMVVTLHHQTARQWLTAMQVPSRTESLQALAEHRDLAKAIAAGDATAAQAAMEKALGDLPDDVKRS